MFEIRNDNKTVMEIDIGQIAAKTDLHMAAKNGHSETVELLIDNGANVNVKTTFGYTPLHLAAKNGHPQTVQALIDKRADRL